MLKKLVEKNRSVRRFHESERIEPDLLKELVALARLTPSASNLQSLRYKLVYEPSLCAKLFSSLKWAAYLKGWPGPEPGERPAAYIIVCRLLDSGPFILCDMGIAAQTMALGAVEKGLSACMLAAIDKKSVSRDFSLPDNLEVILCLALGRAAEKVVVEDMEEGSSVKYWRDEESVHYVPKRLLDDLLL